MRVLGLAFSGHGSSICLVENGKIVRAVNLERLTRKKFSLATLPRYVKFLQNVTVREFESDCIPEYFNFYDVFPRMLRYITGYADLSKAGIDLIVKTRDNIGRLIEVPYKSYYDDEYLKLLEYFKGIPIHFEMEHHLGHAYQAYLCSPFDEAAVITVDGTGEKLERLGLNSITTTFSVGKNNRIRVLSEVYSPFSIGGAYSNFTRYLGFRDNQEGNTMALASFGSDDFFQQLDGTWSLLENGHFDFRFNSQLNDMVYLERLRDYCPPRKNGEPIDAKHKNVAWAIQNMTEKILIHAAQKLHEKTGLKRLAVAGGVGLNCVTNSKIIDETGFEEIYIMPNAGDRGLAAGCALFGYHVLLGGKERVPLTHDYLGRSYSEQEILAALGSAKNIEYRKSNDIANEVAGLIEKQYVVGWHQGGSEFGPRALGNRSILADPRTKESKTRLDQEIKRREWFRPYAPSVLEEHAGEYFDLNAPSPYMLMAPKTRVEVKEKIAGVVHVDGSARVQTVSKVANPLYHSLISAFYKRTGIPLVLNTSFNGNGDPIVETPGDAIEALLKMNLDALAIGDYLVWKMDSPGKNDLVCR